MNIYVGNIAHEVSEDEIKQAFQEFGEVISVTILKDKYTGDPRGFGFVEMPNKSEALKAMQSLNSTEIKGRHLIINEARPKRDDRNKRKRGHSSRRW